ncbi:MAG TPA: phytanoyl-CoA dioxygenase family protein [Gammaproteobacteria bacterium]|nr:phytanoyl-CoA dioxygenase family protein [Gammaproteobacteria bacterium]
MLTKTQIEEFGDNGVLLLESLYSAADLEPLQRQFGEWIDESGRHPGPFGEMLDGRPRFDVEPGHCVSAPALRRVASPEEISPVFLDILLAGPMLEAISDLLGDDLRFHHAKLNSKLPGGATRVKWHQDFTFDPHSNDDCITAMLFIDDITPELGPARVVPGSHRGPLHSLWHDGVFTGAVADEVAADCERKAIDCPGASGSLCLMHTRMLHASAENRGTRPRTLYIATLTAADAVPLAPCAVPSRYAGHILHGKDPGRVRSIAFEMEMPEIPVGASFFEQQAGKTA